MVSLLIQFIIQCLLFTNVVSKSSTSSTGNTAVIDEIVLSSTSTTSNSYDINNTTTIKHNEQLPWYNDIFYLPADVAWPGTQWLSRIAESAEANNTTTTYVTSTGQQYTSVYEAMVKSFPSTPPGTVNACRNFNAYINSIVIPNSLAETIVQKLAGGSFEVGHYLLCYLRNFIGAMILYYGVAGAFHYGCYVYYGPTVFDTTGRTRPTTTTIIDQISLAQGSLFLYVLLPVVDEYLVENNYTVAYHTIDEIGGYTWYLLYTILYFTLVEIGIYWMHRTLHTNKILYKYIHLQHHKYNKAETLTPWASIAFHPLDGILQASPYVFVLFVVPCHYLTHFLMLFFTAIWATYIHDAMDFNIDPIMGSKYHTVHHTHYIYNYGQVFIFCDWFWGTLYVPTAPTGTNSKHNNKAAPPVDNTTALLQQEQGTTSSKAKVQ